MLKRLLLRTAVLAVYILLLCWFLRNQQWAQLRQLSAAGIAGCIGLILAMFSLSGVQYWLSLRRLGCRMCYSDILFFPFMQAACGIIIPFQGSTLFAMVYLKIQYHFTISQSMVMVLFLYLLNFLFAGTAGILYAWWQHDFCSLLFLFSLLSLGMPFYLFCTNRILKKIPYLPLIPKSVQDRLREFFQSMHLLFADGRNLLLLIFCQLCRQGCSCILLVLIARELGLPANWIWGYLVTIGQELSVIIKCTPGNLGLAEMIAAAVSALTGIPAANGVMISLVMTVIQLGVCMTVGLTGIHCFLRRMTLSARDFRKIFHAERKEGL